MTARRQAVQGGSSGEARLATLQGEELTLAIRASAPSRRRFWISGWMHRVSRATHRRMLVMLRSRLGLVGSLLPRDWAGNPLFDADWYIHEYPEAGEYGPGPWKHYLRIGRARGFKPNALFDPVWYVERYPDVASSGVEPLDHYYYWGAIEGRDPGPLFSTASYVAAHYRRDPGSDMRGLNPLLHYLRYGYRSSGQEHDPRGRSVEGSIRRIAASADPIGAAGAQARTWTGAEDLQRATSSMNRSSRLEPDFGRSRSLASVREIAASLPEAARIVFAGSRDDELLRMTAGRGSYLIRHRDGSVDVAGRPIAATAALALIEGARWEGKEYLLVPADAPRIPIGNSRLAVYLNRRYVPVECDPAAGSLWALQESSPWRPLDRLILSLEAELGRPPSLLDWGTGLDLQATFPECQVQRTDDATGELPYLDGTFDIVAIGREGNPATREARRVAARALVNVQRNGCSVLWKRDRPTPPPKVSIVMVSPPTVQAAEGFLGRAAESLPDGTDAEFVICGIVDGPIPASWRRAAWSHEITRVRPSGSRASDLARAFRMANGDFCALLDGATVPLPGWLESSIGILRREPDARGICGMLLDGDGRIIMCGAERTVDGVLIPLGAGSEEVDAPRFRPTRPVAAVPVNFAVARRDLPHTRRTADLQGDLVDLGASMYDSDIGAVRPWGLRSDA